MKIKQLLLTASVALLQVSFLMAEGSAIWDTQRANKTDVFADTAIVLATVFPEKEDKVERAVEGQRIFADSDQVFASLPTLLSGSHYLLGSKSEGNRIVPVTEGAVVMVTPLAGQTGSQEELLISEGFTRMEHPSFTLFEGQDVEIGLFKKEFAYKEFRLADIRYEGWAVPFFDAEPLPSFVKPPHITWSPGAAYARHTRLWQGCPSIEKTGKRLWTAWFSGGVREPDEGNYSILSYSDDGETWVDPAMVITHEDKQVRVIDIQLWKDPKGRLWVFWVQNTGQKGFDGIFGTWAIRIDNPEADEPIWTSPRRLCDGLTRNKPIVLTSGEWLLPSYDWTNHQSAVYISNDEGENWTLQGGPLNEPTSNFYEHICVQLNNGNIWMLQRNISESISTDRGKTWTAFEKMDEFTAANSRVYIGRLQSGNLLLVYNDATEGKTRKRLTARLSTDDGKTWPYTLLLDERDHVSYPDMVQDADGLIHVCYDRSRRGAKEILLATFTEGDLIKGAFVDKKAKQKEIISKVDLYNGIRLPDIWPPDTENPMDVSPMRVPYLENPPEIIPIDIGRQLFVDDFLIETTTLTRVFHQAKKYEGNPVFYPETSYELDKYKGYGAVTYLGKGGVFYDPADTLFKMFYTAGWRGSLALATSKDLLNWTRPELGLAGGNTILPPGVMMAGGDNAIWLDLSGKDPQQRYKAIIERWVDGDWRKHFDQRKGLPRHTIHTSSDGRIWSQGVPTGSASDYTSFFYNPFRNKWVYSLKRDTKRGRARFYSENDDFIKGAPWKDAVYWINADEKDNPDPDIGDAPQLYSLNAVAYESLILGQFYIHLGPQNSVSEENKIPKITELKMGFSRDGFHWDRPDRTPFVEATRKEGDWDRAYLHGTMGICIVKGDELWFPYTGYSGIAPDGSRGMYTGASIGMATLRRDGFASMEAGTKRGTLLTRPVIFSGKHLFVNVDCPEGELRVEVLDEKDRVLKQFSAKTSRPIRTDKTLYKVEWEKGDDLSALAGKPIKFRFHLTNGKLYSFWVSPDESGASYGYLGGGAPGVDGVVDDKGINAY